MEIIHLKYNTYQVINLSDYSVLFQGTYDECLAYEENALYKIFMSIGNFQRIKILKRKFVYLSMFNLKNKSYVRFKKR